jgi:HSP20 family protein
MRLAGETDSAPGGTTLRDKVCFPHILFLPAVSRGGRRDWQPPADVYRTPDGWFLKFELAGVRAEDLELTVQGRTLWLQGTRRDHRPLRGADCYYLEITYSRFERALELPGLSEEAEISASYRDGMLLVEITTEGRHE